MKSSGRRPRTLNPAFAAAHGISSSNSIDDPLDTKTNDEVRNDGGNSKTGTYSSSNNSIEIVLKRARDTGKLNASNCAELKNHQNSSSSLPNDFFEFPFNLSRYTEELLTVIDFSDNEDNLGPDPELDERVLQYKSAQSMRFRNCGWKLPSALSFSSLEHLTILDLSGNRLDGSLDIGVLLCSPSKTSALVELNLSNNLIRELRATWNDSKNGDNDQKDGPSSSSLTISLPKLQSLDVSHNPPLESLFEGDDFSCENLRIFRCHHNPNLRFSSYISPSPTSASTNAMDGLPRFLRSASTSLEVLEASHNPKLVSAAKTKPRACPIDLSSFTQLQTCSFALNKLDVVPCIPLSVKSLDLRSNKLASISGIFPTESKSAASSSVATKSQLINLILADNYLTRLDPLLLEQMTQLNRLDLASNKLLALPYQLGFLTSLSALNVSGNPVVTKIPPSVISSSSSGNPQALLELLRNRAPVGKEGRATTLAGGGRAKSIDVAASNLLTTALSSKGRTTLDLERKLAQANPNTLEVLMRELLTTSTNIAREITGQVILDSNELDTLPSDLLSRCLPNVETISLVGNKFTELPPSLQTSCSRTVKELRLGKNLLTSEALTEAGWFRAKASVALSGSWSLNSLTHLDLSSNRLTSFPINTTSEVLCFPALKVLNLFNNRIHNVGDWKRLPASLTTLELSENHIEDIEPLAILLAAHCRGFQRLSLEHNRVKRIPPILGLLASYSPSMLSLNLKGNPQRAVRLDVLDRPCSDILEYLANRMTVDQRNAAIDLIQERQRLEKLVPGTKPMEEHAAVVKDTDIDDIPSAMPSRSVGEEPPASVACVQQEDKLPERTTKLNHKSAGVGRAESEEKKEENDTNVLKELQESVEKYKAQLENLSLTQAKKYALKKSLAMERSKLIREERRLGLRK